MQLIKYLPSFYYGSSEVTNIQSSIGIENDKLQLAIKDLLNQLFISSATWGLDNWETYLGIEVDRGESYDNRRSRIMTRLRGKGTTTKEMIKNVCASFVGGKIEVIEDNANYSFTIKFIDTEGVPSNMDYLLSSLNEIKPAHLGIEYSFTFILIRDLESFTLDKLQNIKIESFAY